MQRDPLPTIENETADKESERVSADEDLEKRLAASSLGTSWLVPPLWRLP